MKIVVFTGAGISAESGLQTFRGDGGLWEGYRVEDVATPAAWERNPAMVQRFYNVRRKAVLAAEPNAAHRYLVDLAKYTDLAIITQNIDDLHERAGSNRVLHLHGQIRKAQSSVDPNYVIDVDGDSIRKGECCPKGSQLRPHVVWFGESVPNMEVAQSLSSTADIFIVIGSSLQVYPAASLVYQLKSGCLLIVVNPDVSQLSLPVGAVAIPKTAVEAVPDLKAIIQQQL